MDARWTALALVAALTLSGCIGPGGPLTENAAVGARQTAPAPATAALALTVTTPAIEPVPDAKITLDTSDGTHRTTTDATGAAHLTDLPPGRAVLTIEAPDHRGRQLPLELAAGSTAERDLVLRPLPANGSFVERFTFEGFFECSATYLFVTGDCLALARSASEQTGLDPDPNATNERFTFPFPIGPGWTSIHVEQTWEEPVAGAGSTMRVNLEPVAPDATDGHSPRFARTQGTSPISLTVEQGQLHPNASDDAMIVPEEGGWLRTRTFHLGLEQTQDPAGTGFLGAGAAIQQPFTVTVEVRYG